MQQGKARQPPVILIFHHYPPSVPTQTSPALTEAPHSRSRPLNRVFKLAILLPQSQVHSSKTLTTITQGSTVTHNPKSTNSELFSDSFPSHLCKIPQSQELCIIYTLCLGSCGFSVHTPITSLAPQSPSIR